MGGLRELSERWRGSTPVVGGVAARNGRGAGQDESGSDRPGLLVPALHAFTVDLEDWYHGIPISPERKETSEKRLQIGTEKLLALLERHGARATFFVLAPTAREYPDLIRRIVAAGHDIGSHGTSHDLLYEMTPDRFRAETRLSIHVLEDIVGRKVDSYRAAYFSVTRQSLWALDILVEEGVRYDSSIFPVVNWRYGIPDFSRGPTVVSTAAGPLLEFPLSTRRLMGRTVPATGGAYFRIYPYAVSRANVEASLREGRPLVFYLHPWELDPAHPVVRFQARAMVTHYFNLGSTERKLARLLTEYRFGSLADVLRESFPGVGGDVLPDGQRRAVAGALDLRCT